MCGGVERIVIPDAGPPVTVTYNAITGGYYTYTLELSTSLDDAIAWNAEIVRYGEDWMDELDTIWQTCRRKRAVRKNGSDTGN